MLGASGCSAGGLPAPQEPSAPGLPPSTSPDQPVTTGASTAPEESSAGSDVLEIQRNATDAFGPLPLEAFGQTRAERYVMETTIDALADDCMKEFGFAPSAAPESLEVVEIEERESRNRLFGIIDVDQARVSGYLPAWVVRSNARGTEEPADPAYVFVLTGKRDGDSNEDQTTSPGEVGGKAIPPNGCLGAAREKVYGTNSEMMPFLFQPTLAKEMWLEAQQDKRVLDAESQWKECMGARGFPRDSMWNTDNEFLDIPEDERPTDTEILAAVADAECNLAADYASTYYEVLVELENQAIEDNQLALVEERQEIEAALARANDLAREN